MLQLVVFFFESAKKRAERDEEQRALFESLLIHKPSPFYGLQPLSLWLLLFLQSGAPGQDVAVFFFCVF